MASSDIVANLQRSRRVDLPSCANCGTQMREILSIAPLFNEPGLVAYECPQCGHIASELTAMPPDGARR